MPGPDDDPRDPGPALDVQREVVIGRLRDAAEHRLIDLETFDRRVGLALRASRTDELDVLVADFPAAALPALVAHPAPTGFDARDDDAPERLTAIFSGIDKKGPRTLARRIRARAMFGGITLDLRDATFRPGTTTVRCDALFGGIDIRVPPHVRVEVSGSGLFGGFDSEEGDGVPGADSTAPVLRVEGKAIFGGVSVKRVAASPLALPR